MNFSILSKCSYLQNTATSLNDYEKSNHLGNVLAVISDRKIARDTDQDNTVDYYEPDVLLTYDYSPFGAPLHARSFTKEVCDEVTSTQKIEDLNTDFTDGTAQGWQAMGNTALTVNTSGQLKIEKNGGGQLMGATQSFMAISGELYDFTITIDKGSCNSNADILLEVLDANSTIIYTQTLNSGTQTYTTQFTASTSGAYVITVQRINNTSNCYFLIDDVLITHEEEVTQTLCEDFAGYRYGFNGQEKDDEVKGSGNNYDYGFRIYGSRLGRFLSIDPLMDAYPFYTPYQFAGNKPIWAIDLDGLEEYRVTGTSQGYMVFFEPLDEEGKSKKQEANIRYEGVDGINDGDYDEPQSGKHKFFLEKMINDNKGYENKTGKRNHTASIGPIPLPAKPAVKVETEKKVTKKTEATSSTKRPTEATKAASINTTSTTSTSSQQNSAIFDVPIEFALWDSKIESGLKELMKTIETIKERQKTNPNIEIIIQTGIASSGKSFDEIKGLEVPKNAGTNYSGKSINFLVNVRGLVIKKIFESAGIVNITISKPRTDTKQVIIETK